MKIDFVMMFIFISKQISAKKVEKEKMSVYYDRGKFVFANFGTAPYLQQAVNRFSVCEN